MSDGASLFRRLECDWQRQGASAEARSALARWAEAQPVLRGLGSPLEVVRRCHDRRDPSAGRVLVAAVLAEAADDPVAATTVVQALLPGIAGVAHRARGLFEGKVAVWESYEELDQHVVTLAYERVAALAGTTDPWAARVIVDGIWQRLRNYARAERRRARCQDDFARKALRLEPAPSAADELAGVLADAVERGVVERAHAEVVYSVRVGGRPPEVVAPAVGHSARTVWRWLRRAEDALVSDGHGLGRRDLSLAGRSAGGGG